MRRSTHWMAWVAGGMLGIALCLAYGAAGAVEQEAPPPPPPKEAPTPPAVPGTAPAAAPAAAPATPPAAAPAKRVVRTFKLYADNWNWTPDAINVKQGDHVILKLHAYRASRSFVLKGYKIDKAMPQDEDVVVEFDADKAGEFPWKCGRPCGNGCAKMRGKLIVE